MVYYLIPSLSTSPLLVSNWHVVMTFTLFAPCMTWLPLNLKTPHYLEMTFFQSSPLLFKKKKKEKDILVRVIVFLPVSVSAPVAPEHIVCTINRLRVKAPRDTNPSLFCLFPFKGKNPAREQRHSAIDSVV